MNNQMEQNNTKKNVMITKKPVNHLKK